MLIIQACQTRDAVRDSQLDIQTRADAAPNYVSYIYDSPFHPPVRPGFLVQARDMLVLSATVDGNMVDRNVFLPILAELLVDSERDANVLSILEEVSRKVRQQAPEQICYAQTSLSKTLRLKDYWLSEM